MPISAESRYCLDGAYELLYLVTDIYEAAYRNRLDIDGFVDRGLPVAETVHRLFGVWYPTAPAEEKVFLAYKAALESDAQLNNAMNFAASIVVDQYFIGSGQGLGLPIRRSLALITEEAGILDRANVAAALQYHTMGCWCREFQAQVSRVQNAIDLMSTRAFIAWLKEEYRPTTFVGCLSERDFIEHHVAERWQADKRKLRATKKAVKKSVRLFEQIVGPQHIRAFLSGDGFQIDGARYRYAVDKAGIGILDHTMSPYSSVIPYNLSVLRKSDNVRLAGGCVVFDGTPLLDQIIAMCLHVRDHEDELDFLKATNLSRTKDFEGDEFLVALKGGKVPSIAQAIFGTSALREPLSLREHFEQMFGDHVLKQQLVQRVRPIVEDVFCELYEIPRYIFNGMLHPPVTVDELRGADEAWIAGFEAQIAETGRNELFPTG